VRVFAVSPPAAGKLALPTLSTAEFVDPCQRRHTVVHLFRRNPWVSATLACADVAATAAWYVEALGMCPVDPAAHVHDLGVLPAAPPPRGGPRIVLAYGPLHNSPFLVLEPCADAVAVPGDRTVMHVLCDAAYAASASAREGGFDRGRWHHAALEGSDGMRQGATPLQWPEMWLVDGVASPPPPGSVRWEGDVRDPDGRCLRMWVY